MPRRRLVEALWGEDPPRTAVKSLHSHVARLRIVLEKCGAGGVLQTRGQDYALCVDPVSVDAGRFEQQLQSIRKGLSKGEVEEALDALAHALGLWRGEALADAEPTGWMAAEAARLDGLRSAALADRCEAMLSLGHYGPALSEVERLLATDPLRERLTGLHMIALWGCGRPAEALDAYQRLRQDLAEELGVDPSQELQGLHTSMLRGVAAGELRAPGSVVGARRPPVQVAPALRPAQLPAPVGYFTGRARELGALEEVLTSDSPVVALICGPGGFGKTALAVQWAHRVAARFPDGQLFVDARGHDKASAMTAVQLTGVLLRCLGVAEDRLPPDLSERVGLYRSLLAGKRMLIVIDNACNTEQIAPLIPGSAASQLVVTSRASLAALVTHAEVRYVALEAMSAAEAGNLLAKVIGPERIAHEVLASQHLAELCSRMPLALRIAAAKLAAQPARAISAFVAELSAGDRLAQLGIENGTRSVEAVFASAYSALSPTGQRLFRRLGLHPGPHLSLGLAAALTATPSAMEELVAAHLIAEVQPGQFRFHDLIRIFAYECALRDEAPAARDEAIQRGLEWYLTAAQAGSQLLDNSHDLIVPTLRFAPAPRPFAPAREAALSFLDTERDNLQAVASFASANGHFRMVCELTYLLASYFDARGSWLDRIEMCQLAVAAAQELADVRVEAEMHRALGAAYRFTYQLRPALDSHLRALELMRDTGDDKGLAYVYNNIGGARVELRQFDEAVAAYQLSSRLHLKAGNQHGAAVARRNLGYTYIRMERADLALSCLAEVLDTSRAIGHQRVEAGTLDSLGEAYLQLEQFGNALECFQQALSVSRAIGNRRYEMDALANIGLAHLGSGAISCALESFAAALALSRELGHRHAEARILHDIAEAHVRHHEPGIARRFLSASAVLRQSIPDSYEQARWHRTFGEVCLLEGSVSHAREHWEKAAGLFRAAGAGKQADQLVSQRVQLAGMTALVTALVITPADG